MHSSVAENILWCVRFGAPKEGKKVKLRGSNPLSCKICAVHIRNKCPAFEEIQDKLVTFNSKDFKNSDADFNVVTSDENNKTKGQSIEGCEGVKTKDVYSTRDRSVIFNTYPVATHTGSDMTVHEFLSVY